MNIDFRIFPVIITKQQQKNHETKIFIQVVPPTRCAKQEGNRISSQRRPYILCSGWGRLQGAYRNFLLIELLLYLYSFSFYSMWKCEMNVYFCSVFSRTHVQTWSTRRSSTVTSSQIVLYSHRRPQLKSHSLLPHSRTTSKLPFHSSPKAKANINEVNNSQSFNTFSRCFSTDQAVNCSVL